MNMHLIDWSIVTALIVVLTAGALSTRKYTKSVSAFLVADRLGGRYLLTVANSMAQLGVISLVWFFEMNYEIGFTSIWWGLMEGPALIVMALSGWVIYRFRQTRAMTLPQFFELRYSKNFRVFSGLLAYLAGIINFGIFPSVGSRFFIHLCGLPENFCVLGITVSTFVAVMFFLLGTSLFFTFIGGHIAVMVTDFIQGIFANFVFAVVIIFCLVYFNWDRIGEVLLAAPAEQSLVHPFHIGQEEHFNFWYFAISIVIIFYSVQGWQGTQGYNCCAKSPHEMKMSIMLQHWRFRVFMLIVLVVPIGIRVLMTHPDFADKAAVVNDNLAPLETEALRNQLRTPIALATFLPTGIIGLFCAAMLAAFISTHDSYLHSWGSILVQDVILPFRKKPFTPSQHIWLLRISIFVVAAFIFVFSLLFRHAQFIAMYCAITATVFIGGAGVAIIGGLYWKRGTTNGAWSAMITGMVLSFGGIIVKQFTEKYMLSIDGTAWCSILTFLRQFTGQEMTFWTIVIAVAVYIATSLLGPRQTFNMDKLLHRGKYAVAGETSTSFKDARTVMEKLGFSSEFTGRDKIVAYVTLAWPLVWTLIFIVGTIYNLTVDVTNESWLKFWKFYTYMTLAAFIIVMVWFAIGGFKDVVYLYRKLRTTKVNELDDGRVIDGHNIGEDVPEETDNQNQT